MENNQEEGSQSSIEGVNDDAVKQSSQEEIKAANKDEMIKAETHHEEDISAKDHIISYKINFTNHQIDTSTLPRLDKIEFQKLQEDGLYVDYVSTGIFCLICLVIAAMVGFFSETVRPYILYIYLVIILFFVFLVYAEFRSFKKSGYALREEDLFYKTGWLWTSMLAIPYKRIQHMEVSQGPISRLFDLATVSVYTAGGTSSDMEIEGVKQEEAEAIKAFILQKNKNIKEAARDNDDL